MSRRGVFAEQFPRYWSQSLLVFDAFFLFFANIDLHCFPQLTLPVERTDTMQVWQVHERFFPSPFVTSWGEIKKKFCRYPFLLLLLESTSILTAVLKGRERDEGPEKRIWVGRRIYSGENSGIGKQVNTWVFQVSYRKEGVVGFSSKVHPPWGDYGGKGRKARTFYRVGGVGRKSVGELS